MLKLEEILCEESIGRRFYHAQLEGQGYFEVVKVPYGYQLKGYIRDQKKNTYVPFPAVAHSMLMDGFYTKEI